MTQDFRRPAEFASREQRLDACLRQLLNVTELNMDDMEDERGRRSGKHCGLDTDHGNES